MNHSFDINMPINKFGTLLEGNGADQFSRYNALIRNYVRDNALCTTAADYDARSRKVKRVAEPTDDGDAANKRYVQQNVNILKDRLEKLDKKIERLEKQNVRILKDYLEEFNKKTEILESTMRTILNTIRSEHD